MTPLTSLSELHDIAATLPAADEHARRVAAERQQMLTKPPGSLGRLEDIALWLATWQGSARPTLDICQTIVFAGNHGIAKRGVSAFPPAVTEQMVANFRNGGAAINQLCKSVGAALDVCPLHLDRPTADFSEKEAMTEEECLTAINAGMAAVNPEADIIALGEMGIGNTTTAAALCCGLFGGDPSTWVGRGTGVDDSTLALKASLIRVAIKRHHSALDDPAAVLRCLGGRELAAICGATLAARVHRIPVILDGFVCTAAAAPLAVLAESGLDHCLVGHSSVEPGHRLLLEKLGKTALLDLQMRLGEASGAVLALGTLKSAVALHNGMATFAEAGVSERPS
ncbi:MAG: nicotinate-nucleotide--dimethylbenzimidazole phosphoribosyltransferase [Alphaproteobacteria bacterium]